MISGKLTVWVGPMFADKTTHLLETYWKQKLVTNTLLIKPKKDNRYDERKVVTHSGLEAEADCVLGDGDNVFDICLSAGGGTDIFVDEPQFIPGIGHVIKLWLMSGYNVYVSGLDLWSNGEPVPEMLSLLAYADEVYKLKAKCKCGQPASKTQKLRSTGTIQNVDKGDLYAPACNDCWEPLV